MGALAVFGIENDGLNLAVNLLILFLVVIWLALVYWTYADARRRIADPLLVGCAAAASLFPFVGTIVYVIVRPPEYLEDVRERELEIAAAEVAVVRLGESHAAAAPPLAWMPTSLGGTPRSGPSRVSQRSDSSGDWPPPCTCSRPTRGRFTMWASAHPNTARRVRP
jgi:membrane-associated protease RseP (regulator of RpoE activity)